MRNVIQVGILITVFLISAFAGHSQIPGISGKVTSEVNGKPLSGVSVEIPKLKLSAETDENGAYQFNDIKNGTYTVVTHIEGFSDKAQPVTVAGGIGKLDFELSLVAIRAEVTVTATGTEQSVLESFSSVNSVGATRIAEKASTSIGEILENEAGVSKRSFGGGGTGRPSIRGFEGDRVLVLQDGVRNGSVGSTSGDHGEPISPMNLERLEVIKGPGTLLYGSNALGGVVNAVTDDENSAHEGFRGYFSGLAGSINRQAGFAGGLEFGVKKLMFNTNFNAAREGDYDTPFGRIPNSASRAFGGAGSVGYFGEKGFVRGTLTLDRRRYGIPYAPLFESGEILSIANGGIDCTPAPEGKNPPECQFNLEAIKTAFSNGLPPIPDEQIDIKMRRNNYRLTAGFNDLKSPITRGDFYIDFTDYQHQEIEVAGITENVATTFDNDVFSYRALFEQAKHKLLSGRFGFDGYRRSYLTQGAEQLVEGMVRHHNFSAFTLQEISFERISFQFGARIENNQYRPTSQNLNSLSFTGFSGAVGAKFDVWKGGVFVVDFTSSNRAPALEELYNLGAHVGTVTFEVGDQTLQRERSNAVEFSFRQNAKRVRFNGSIYYYDINNFVYLAPQDADGNGFVDVEDFLPIARYSQENARFFGADASLDFDINRYVGAFVVGDLVNAKLKAGDVPIPRISPARLRIGADLNYKGFSLRPEAVLVAKKDVNDIFSLETTTAGYGILNINGTYTFVIDKTAHVFTFGGQNLTDKLYRSAGNFIKDLAPETGRGFKLSYTVRFY
jgi:iron complex outermembrane recepter protein